MIPKLNREFKTEKEAIVFSSVVKGKIFTGSNSFLVVYEPRKVVYEPRKEKVFNGFKVGGKYIGCSGSINPKSKLRDDNHYYTKRN